MQPCIYLSCGNRSAEFIFSVPSLIPSYHSPSPSSCFISSFSLPSSFYSMCLLIRRELKIKTAHHPGKFLRTLWTNLSNSIKPMPDFSPIVFLSAVVLVLPWVSQLPNCSFFNNSILISPSSAQLSRTHSIRAQTLQLTWTNFTSPSRSQSCTSHRLT